MSSYRRTAVACIVTLMAGTTLLAQANKPGTNPNSPIAPQPQVVDRDGKVVGAFSVTGTGFVVYTLADGRKALLRWTRDRLSGHVSGSPHQMKAGFRSNDCSGPAYVLALSAGMPLSDPGTLVLEFVDPTSPTPISDGSEVQMMHMRQMLYVTETGARRRWWVSDFTSHWSPLIFGPDDTECKPGPPPLLPPEGYVEGYVFNETGIDLSREFAYPFRVVE